MTCSRCADEVARAAAGRVQRPGSRASCDAARPDDAAVLVEGRDRDARSGDRVRRAVDVDHARALRHARRLRAREHDAHPAARRALGDLAGRPSYHFWLRAGLAYADGKPIVAADFKTSFERTRAMADSPFGPYLAPLSEIEVPNDRELVLHLDHPDATFLYVLTMTFTTPSTTPSGPYMVELVGSGASASCCARTRTTSIRRARTCRASRCSRTSRATPSS